MSYQIKFGNKTVKDTFYTLAPVNWVLKIFVLSNVKRNQNNLSQCWSWIATIAVLSVMLILNIFFLVFKVQRIEGHLYGQIRFTDSLQLTYLLGFAEYTVDLFFVYKMRHICVKYLQFYANIDKLLKLPDFSRIRMKNLTSVMLLIFGYTVSALFDYFSWAFNYGWIEPMLYSLDYAYGFINALTILDVISNVLQIEYRLKVIQECIEVYYASSLDLSGDMDENFEPIEKKRVDKLRTVSYSKGYGMLSLSKCYVMLMEQVNFINTAYGVRLGAFCVNILINLIYLINLVIRILLGQIFTSTYTAYHLAAASTVLRTANYAVVMFLLVYRCEQTYKRSGQIVRLVDLTVVTKTIPSEMKTTLVELRALVLSRPIRFHGANLFTLDYPLLVSVASVVVTYSIILLQSVR